jgi:hypothetical protein
MSCSMPGQRAHDRRDLAGRTLSAQGAKLLHSGTAPACGDLAGSAISDDQPALRAEPVRNKIENLGIKLPHGYLE